MRIHLALIALLMTGRIQAASPPAAITLENAHFRYTLASDGRNLGFVDRATGVDYLRHSTPTTCALVRRGKQEYPATAAALADDRLTLKFGGAAVEANLQVVFRPTYIQLTVEAIRGGPIDSLVFLNIPLTLHGQPDEAFGACVFSLNLITRVDQLPALQNELRASCHQKFGLAGAKVALVGMPMRRMLPALQAVLSDADEMPLCKVGGPWAQETPFNHGSYLFNFGTLTESTVDDWIAMARDLGFTQIDNHGGGAGFFRFGDFELNREKWPDGWETYRRIVARLHRAEIGSIFHTYAFFIDKQSKYVTPVPDPRLDAFRTFTLAEPVTPDSQELRVNESTAEMSTVTGFFEHNSVVLHLGDELVTFDGVSHEPPWRFTRVKRGAFGTTPAAHQQGSEARHLKECFGLFVPNPESSLFEEIAANHADIVNQCGFDGIYLDAIDGSSILRGGDECWYWADKFVFEIQKRLKKPVGMEMSAMWHHFWQYRTRWQAWDYPQRGHKRFVDLHAETVHGGLLLPLHLGWWNFQSFNPPQVEPTYPDVMEQLGARLIGWDAGISLTGAVDRDRLRNVPLFRRAVDLLRTCEELRHSNALDASVRAQLREPGKEFSLVKDAGGRPRFRHAHSHTQTLSPAEPWTLDWRVQNPFKEQPIRVRIEALMSAAAYGDSNAIVLADFSRPGEGAWESTTANGVALSLGPSSSDSPWPTTMLTATNSGIVPRKAAWTRLTRRFDPPLNLKEHQALGLWVEGDGLGEIIAVRLESPQHIAYGAIADRYVTVDFTGRRLLTLVETEAARWSDYVWNDGKGLYNVYRETIHFDAVESASVWCQNLPPGKEVNCRVGPIKALPMLPGTVDSSALTVNGIKLTFPVKITSGSWIECNGPNDCVLYRPKGEALERVSLQNAFPALQPGENQVQFSCAPSDGPAPRVRVTVFCHGEML